MLAGRRNLSKAGWVRSRGCPRHGCRGQDALDLHYRLHWVAREAQRQGAPMPGALEGGVIYERHYALNWLFCFEQADWDDVDTPT
ncbi:hypothetical protein C7E13_19565 [Stenotrophomonas maltophilia]|nr:hypothetical protein C7E13_19565 [Stenotrophomonas maltophilia]